FGERFHRRIAALGFLAQRHQYDVVEIAGEAMASRARRGNAWTRGLNTRDGLLHLAGAHAIELVRRTIGEQLIEHRAERIDVARGADRLSTKLLGARIFGCEETRAGLCETRRRFRAFEWKQLCDTEVEKLGDAIGGHQNIRWLEIAMHNEMGMRVLYRVAHSQKQPEPRLHRAALALTPRPRNFHAPHYQA